MSGDAGRVPEQEDPARATQADAQEETYGQPWWRRSPPAAAAASVVIGAATLWFGNMLNRVPLDDHATLGYLLMLPLLLIVPAFSAAGLRLAWLGLKRRAGNLGLVIAAIALVGAAVNLLAIGRFARALIRIFAG
jgi:hypothetical protein